MAQSLWREHDLDLRDNHAGRLAQATPGRSCRTTAPRADGRPYPAHSPGLPLLLAPLYALGGRALCVIALTLAAAALALEIWRSARRLTGDDEAALLGWALALVPPVAFYAFEIYTEVPSALALAVSLRLVLAGPGAVGAAAAAVLAGGLPWLHLKMLPAAVALAVIAAVRLRGRARAAFFAVALVLGRFPRLLPCDLRGRLTPRDLWRRAPDATARPCAPWWGLALDRSFGLLPYAPVFLVAWPGRLCLVRRRAWNGSPAPPWSRRS